MPENIENIVVQGFAGSIEAVAATLTGNAINNRIVGHDNDETINGFDGKDDLVGKGGDDHLNGGNGNDHLDGGDGADSLGGGVGNDSLNGRLGDDLMTGGLGNDTYYVDSSGDVVAEIAGEGIDTIRVSISDYTLPSNVENGHVNSGPGLKLTGNALGNLLVGGGGHDDLIGLAGDDVLEAGTGNDVLIGGDRNDYLAGGPGLDNMSGGPGDDVYEVESQINDFPSEAVDEGIDTIRSYAVSYTLGSNFENGVVLYAGGGALTGNSLANELTGNDFSNVMEGGSGNDILTGNGGSDFLDGESGNDDLFGGDGSDSLFGSTGIDDMTGGAGADIFQYTATSQASSILYDRIHDFDTSTTGDTLDLSAIDANTLVAGDQDFVIVGSPSGAAGELWLSDLGNGKFALRGNTDGDSTVELLIYLTKADQFSDFHDYNFVL